MIVLRTYEFFCACYTVIAVEVLTMVMDSKEVIEQFQLTCCFKAPVLLVN